MNQLNLSNVRARAMSEFQEESIRLAIDAEKARLRAQPKTSLWQRLTSKLPFTIRIVRRVA